jgi:hypothetical protein
MAITRDHCGERNARAMLPPLLQISKSVLVYLSPLEEELNYAKTSPVDVASARSLLSCR